MQRGALGAIVNSSWPIMEGDNVIGQVVRASVNKTLGFVKKYVANLKRRYTVG